MQAPLFYALPSIEVIDVAKILFAMSHLRPFLTYG